MAVCFICVVGLTLTSKEENTKEFSSDTIYGVIIAFIAGWLSSACAITNRKLKGVHPGFVILWPAMLGTVIFSTYLTGRWFTTG